MKELSLHLLDLIENSAAAGATRIEITIHEDQEADRLTLQVRDNGRGMPPEVARSATDPFTTTRTHRAVGLGLPLLAAAAEQAGGHFSLASTPDQGAAVDVDFQLSHIDRAPLGRIEDTLAAAAALYPDLELAYEHRGPRGSYQLDSRHLQHCSTPADTAREIRRLVREGLRLAGSTA